MSPVEDIANLIWALTRLENPGDSRLAMLEKLCGLAQKQIWHLEPQAPMLTDALVLTWSWTHSAPSLLSESVRAGPKMELTELHKVSLQRFATEKQNRESKVI